MRGQAGEMRSPGRRGPRRLGWRVATFAAASTIAVATAATAGIVVVDASPEAHAQLVRDMNLLAGDVLAATLAGTVGDREAPPTATEWRLRVDHGPGRGLR